MILGIDCAYASGWLRPPDPLSDVVRPFDAPRDPPMLPLLALSLKYIILLDGIQCRSGGLKRGLGSWRSGSPAASTALEEYKVCYWYIDETSSSNAMAPPRGCCTRGIERRSPAWLVRYRAIHNDCNDLHGLSQTMSCAHGARSSRRDVELSSKIFSGCRRRRHKVSRRWRSGTGTVQAGHGFVRSHGPRDTYCRSRSAQRGDARSDPASASLPAGGRREPCNAFPNVVSAADVSKRGKPQRVHSCRRCCITAWRLPIARRFWARSSPTQQPGARPR
jgi:hypothetical protein